MSERVYFSGRTLEQAIQAAARHHQIDPEALAYQQIEKRHGFVKQPRGVVIRVDPANPQADATTSPAEDPSSESAPSTSPPEPVEAGEPREVPEPAEDPVPESPVPESPVAETPVPEVQARVLADAEELADRETGDEVTKEDSPEGDGGGEKAVEAAVAPARRESPRSVSPRSEGSPASGSPASSSSAPAPSEEAIEDAAVRWLDSLLDLGALDLDFEVQFGEEGLEIDLEGPDEEVVLDEEGELLRAFQHLLPRLIQNEVGQLVHCRVDCDDFQAKREKGLRDLARKVADEVADRGRPKTLRPMHPADRRIVHLELADDPDVFTESVGSGYFKRVMVRSD